MSFFDDVEAIIGSTQDVLNAYDKLKGYHESYEQARKNLEDAKRIIDAGIDGDPRKGIDAMITSLELVNQLNRDPHSQSAIKEMLEGLRDVEKVIPLIDERYRQIDDFLKEQQKSLPVLPPPPEYTGIPTIQVSDDRKSFSQGQTYWVLKGSPISTRPRYIDSNGDELGAPSWSGGEWKVIPRLKKDPSRKDQNLPSVDQAVWKKTAAAATWRAARDPLALDLDGDGVETTPADGKVIFDHDGDGAKTGTGWLSGDDGWLVRDLNGNGLIEKGAELFGVDTVLRDGTKAEDGFAAIRDLDSNADGQLNAADAAWGQLKVWRDLNQDGVSQSGELFTLQQSNVSSVTTKGDLYNIWLENGNMILYSSDYTKIDGSKGIASALNLGVNNFFTTYPDTLPVSDAAAKLPEMTGSGGLRSLREVMSQSPVLLAIVEKFAMATSRAEEMALMAELLGAWGKTSPFGGGSDSTHYRPENGSSRWDGFTDKSEAIRKYEETGRMTLADQSGFHSPEFQLRLGTLPEKIRILEYFTGQAAYENTFRMIYGVRSSSIGDPSVIGKAAFRAKSDEGGSGAEAQVWIGYEVVMGPQMELFEKAYDTLVGSVYESLVMQTRLDKWYEFIDLTVDVEGISLDFSRLDQHIRSAAQSGAKDVLLDMLTFVSGSGFGAIPELSWNYGILLNELVDKIGMANLADIKLQLSAFDVDFSHADDTQSRVLKGTDNPEKGDLLVGGEASDNIEGFGGDNLLIGGGGGDTMATADGIDVLLGGAGNDSMLSGKGGDTLIGGSGNDSMDGHVGDDVYVFNLGDGQDRIIENAFNSKDLTVLGFDTLQFGAGIDVSTLKFVRSGYDLIVRYSETDAVTVAGWFGAVSYGIEQIQFADGSVIAVETLLDSLGIHGTAGSETFDAYYTDGKDYYLMGADGDRANGAGGDDLLFGEAGNDSLNGGAGNDLLNGGIGNDWLDGHVGDDIYVFNLGDGQDKITEKAFNSKDLTVQGFDTLQFGAGIDAGTLKFIRSGHDLIVHYSETDSVTVVGWFGAASYGIEQIQFADGSVVAVETLLDSHGINGTASGDSFDAYYADGKDYYLMGAGDDRANGAAGDDLLFGEAGNDSLNGGIGNDILNGGTGNDWLDGHVGDDVYVFNLGDGQDRITENTFNSRDLTVQGFDTLQFGAGIDISTLKFSRTGHDLIVRYSETDSVTVVGWFGAASYGIEQIRFVDGSVVAVETLLDSHGIHGTASSEGFDAHYTDGKDYYLMGAGDDRANGASGDDLLFGEAGNDVLNGGAGNDLLNGGIGNDWLDGNLGNDTYVFNLGDGQDRIAEASGAVEVTGIDTLAFGAGITADSLVVARAGQDLVIKYSDTDVVTIVAYFSHAAYKIEHIQFADGSSMTTDALLFRNGMRGTAGNDAMVGSQAADLLYGDTGNDTLTGDAGNDVLHGDAGSDSLLGGLGADLLHGGIGNDTLDGFEGDDTYLFSLGNGVDRIAESYGSSAVGQSGLDTLQFGAGIKAEDLRFNRVGQDLVVKYSATDEVTVAAYFNGVGYRVEQILFADGSIVAMDALLLRNGVRGSAGNDAMTGTTSDDQFFGDAGNDALTGDAGNDLLHGEAGNDNLNGGLGNDLLKGGLGADTLTGEVGNDSLYGEADHDSLNGGLGADMLNGGIGNDTLDGNLGDDTYAFNLGDGQDRIAETWGAVDVTGSDTLVFGAGITADSLVLARMGQDLMIKYSATDSVTIAAHFNHVAYKVEQIQFADGSTMTTDALLLRNGIRGTTGNDAMVGSQAADLIFGDAGNDTLNADSGNDLLHGEAGNDSLNGVLGADMLNGGIGNDTLDGGEGNDVYLFNLGDGVDRIYETYGFNAVAQSGLDTVQFGAGVKAEDLRFTRVGQDLIVKYSATDEVTVTAYFNSVGYRVEQVQFADGSVVAMDALLLRNGIRGSAGNDAMTGTAIDDQLYGDAGNDTLNADAGNDLLHGEAGNDSLNGALGADMLNGGIGNDTLDGGEGNDVYLFNLGDGVDRVAESYGFNAAAQSGLDTLQFGAGIKAEDLRFTRVGQDLVVKYSATDEITVAAHFNSAGYRVEQIKLADGTVLNTQEVLLLQGLVKTSPVVRMPQMEQAAISANRQLNALVDAMASFAPTEMGSLNLSTQLEEQYRPMAVNTL